jgi:hypothetical protein
VISRAVCEWSGVPITAAEVADLAADLTAMVDGFATLGPRHWRARRARGRWERRLATLIDQVRAGSVVAPAGSALSVVAHFTETDGEPLDSEHGAVELLNVLRPTVAVSLFVAFVGHALHRWPEHRALCGPATWRARWPSLRKSGASTRSRRSSAAGRSAIRPGRTNVSRPGPWCCSICSGRT